MVARVTRVARPLLVCTLDADCMSRYLQQNMDWLEEELGGYEDEYLIIDCPGQANGSMSATRKILIECRAN